MLNEVILCRKEIKTFLFAAQSSDSELKKAVHWALEAGYRHFDTAYLYVNENAIGEVFQDWIQSGKLKREDLFVTTKVRTSKKN